MPSAREVLAITLGVLAAVSAPALAQDLCTTVSGAVLIAQDESNTFLGKIANSYDSQSIFNEYGTFGSQYSSTSIWNQYAKFGGEYNTYSPFNKYASTPPMIIKNKKIIGYLSANKTLGSSVAPDLLKALCKDEL